jgi:hypothetical protein
VECRKKGHAWKKAAERRGEVVDKARKEDHVSKLLLLSK